MKWPGRIVAVLLILLVAGYLALRHIVTSMRF